MAKFQDLTVAQRIKLVEDLWDSISSEQDVLPLTPSQKAELDRRLDELEGKTLGAADKWKINPNQKSRSPPKCARTKAQWDSPVS